MESDGAFNLINAAVMNNSSTGSFGSGGGLEFNSSAGGGTLNIVGSTFAGNRAFEGGAIHLEDGAVRISNTTISGNTATGGLGGGISNWQSNLTIVNSTITGNSATGTDIYGSAGGVVNIDLANITVANSIIAGNSGDNPDVGDGTGNTGRFVSLGHNLIGNHQGAQEDFPAGIPNANADLVGTSAAPVNPQLAALADNGGQTPTHALAAGSPATNAGNPGAPGSGSPACELTDQRGYARPDRCDIGAFELNGIPNATAPGVTVNQAAGQADPTSTNPVLFTAEFSEPVSGFAPADVTLAGTANLAGATVSISGGPSSYSISVDGLAGSGTVIATLAANVVTNLARNGNTASTSTDNTVSVNFDSTPPVITPNVGGTPGSNGWYVGDVSVSWSVTDPESTVTSQTGCDPQSVTSDTPGVTFTCSATSGGGSSSQDVTVRIDKSAPVFGACPVAGPFALNSGQKTITQSAPDAAISGLAASTLTGSVDTSSSGSKSVTFSATDNAGNTATQQCSYTVNSAPTLAVAADGAACLSDSSAKGVIKLVIGDADGAPSPLTLSLVSSSNTALVPNNSAVLGGSGANRTLTVTAAAKKSGTALLTLRVSDGLNSTDLQVTVVVGTDKNETLNGTGGSDLIFGLLGANSINGLGANDLLCGGNGVDTLNGGDGDDTLGGNRGDDVLNGQNGNDRLTGGQGADRFSGGPGTDGATDFTSSQGDTQDGTVEGVTVAAAGVEEPAISNQLFLPTVQN